MTQITVLIGSGKPSAGRIVLIPHRITAMMSSVIKNPISDMIYSFEELHA